jgi:hypothetical protein
MFHLSEMVKVLSLIRKERDCILRLLKATVKEFQTSAEGLGVWPPQIEGLLYNNIVNLYLGFILWFPEISQIHSLSNIPHIHLVSGMGGFTCPILQIRQVTFICTSDQKLTAQHCLPALNSETWGFCWRSKPRRG